MHAQTYQPDKSLGRGERRNTIGTCPTVSKSWTNGERLLSLWKLQSFKGIGKSRSKLAGRASSIQTTSLDFGHGDLMLLDLLVKRASGNAETPGRLLNTTLLLLKNAFDVLLLKLQKCETRVEERGADLRVPIKVKVVDGDVFLVTQQHRSFYNVT